MKNTKTFKQGNIIWDMASLRKGVFIVYNRDDKTAQVEFTTSYNKETSERTSKRENVNINDLRIYKEKRRKNTRKREVNLWASVRPGAIIPSKRKEDAGYDIYSCFDEDEIVLHRLMPNLVSTGIASSIPSTHYFNVKHERGSTGKYAMLLLSGCIDSGYRGEWFINICPLYKDVVISKTYDFPVEEGKKKPVELEDKIMYPYDLAIAQAVKLPVSDDINKEITYEELKKIPSNRGTGALGSSGK